MQEKIVEIKKSEVIESPKDTIEDAEIKSLTKMTWREYLTLKNKDPKKLEEILKKFQNPEQPVLIMVFQTQSGIIEEDTASVYEKINDRSKLGKIINKYGDLKEGTKIKVVFDGNGYPEIKTK